MMTLQEIFDKSARHLLTQNARSITVPTGVCLYRGPGGLQCAAGPFVTDEQADMYNSKAITQIPGIAATYGDEGLSLLVKLQNIHDNNFDVNTWPDLLRKLASDLSLSPSVVDELRPVNPS